MIKICDEILSSVEKGGSCVLVTVVASSGSTPRGAGARMLVGKEGRIAGTVGGGSVEFQSIVLAQQCLTEKSAALKLYRLSPNQIEDLGMVCGGAATLFFSYFDGGCAEKIAAVKKLRDCLSANEKCYMIMDVTEDGSGDLRVETGGAYETGILRDDGGKTLFVEQMVSGGVVYIFGGGHVAQALTPILSYVGFKCYVADDRAEFSSRELFPAAAGVCLIDFENIGETFKITENDYAIVMTRGHSHDTGVQAQLLKTDAKYIGVIGSKKKKLHVQQRLLEMGFSQQTIDRVKTPVGLDIAAETPEEIAISICGEMIQIRAKTKTL